MTSNDYVVMEIADIPNLIRIVERKRNCLGTGSSVEDVCKLWQFSGEKTRLIIFNEKVKISFFIYDQQEREGSSAGSNNNFYFREI